MQVRAVSSRLLFVGAYVQTLVVCRRACFAGAAVCRRVRFAGACGLQALAVCRRGLQALVVCRRARFAGACGLQARAVCRRVLFAFARGL